PVPRRTSTPSLHDALPISDPRARDKFVGDLKNFLPIAEKLECSAIIVLSGNRVEGLSHDAHHEACIEALKRGADLAAKQKATLRSEEHTSELQSPDHLVCR